VPPAGLAAAAGRHVALALQRGLHEGIEPLLEARRPGSRVADLRGAGGADGVAGGALSRVDLLARAQGGGLRGVADVDLAHGLDAAGDGFRRHAVAAGAGAMIVRDVVDEQDDRDHRDHEGEQHGDDELLGRLDRAFVRQVVLGIVAFGLSRLSHKSCPRRH